MMEKVNDAVGIERTFIIEKSFEEISKGTCGQPILVSFKDNVSKKFSDIRLYLYSYNGLMLPNLQKGDLLVVPAIKEDNYEIVRVEANFTDILNDETYYKKALKAIEKTKSNGQEVRPVIACINPYLKQYHISLNQKKEKMIKIESLKREIQNAKILKEVKQLAEENSTIKDIIKDFNDYELASYLGGSLDA